jgi:hypothetical protein
LLPRLALLAGTALAAAGLSGGIPGLAVGPALLSGLPGGSRLASRRRLGC